MSKTFWLKCIAFGLFISFCNINLVAQTLAFPGAEGFGRFTTGGRGGIVYYVTDTTDNATKPTVGSLRYGITKLTGARTILFKVSGTIDLKAALVISNGDITIAGQSAPGDGICLKGYTFRINASNVIVRYIRSRLGDVNSYIDDAMDANGTYPVVSFKNIIVDHCSMSWSIDETGTFYDIKNFTLQWCILSESLYTSVDPKGDHGYGGIWGGQGSSFHHNLLAHHSSRNPRFCGSRYTGDSLNEIVDMRNNVIYNWGNINSSYGGEGGNYNMINNYYKAGPATRGSHTVSSNSNLRNRICNYTSYFCTKDAFIYPDTVYGGKFYLDGNYVDGYPDVTSDNWTKGMQPDSYWNVKALMARNKLAAPLSVAPITTQSAPDAYLSVLENAGANLPKRDTVDRRIIKETRTGTATFEGAGYAKITSVGVSHPSGIIDSQNDVGAWPLLNSTTPPTDTDGDGMPDNWELLHGLNPKSASDRNNLDTTGYTMLEIYLNSIGSENTLPLNLLSFKAVAKNGVNTLYWNTSDEANSQSFEIESSNDGYNFNRIGCVVVITSTNNSSYSFSENNLNTINTFYRLKMFDKSGSFTYSEIVSVAQASSDDLTVSPNPANKNIIVSHPLAIGNSQIFIYSIDGQLHLKQSLKASTIQTSIDVSKLLTGSYLLVFQNGSYKKNTKFIKR